MALYTPGTENDATGRLRSRKLDIFSTTLGFFLDLGVEVAAGAAWGVAAAFTVCLGFEKGSDLSMLLLRFFSLFGVWGLCPGAANILSPSGVIFAFAFGVLALGVLALGVLALGATGAGGISSSLSELISEDETELLPLATGIKLPACQATAAEGVAGDGAAFATFGRIWANLQVSPLLHPFGERKKAQGAGPSPSSDL